MQKKTAIIFGAGPAGLTAAYDLLKKTDIKPIVFEMTKDIGGLSKTVDFKGNRIDIGPHRYFSKSDAVIKWWTGILPLQGAPARDDLILQRDLSYSNEINAPDPEKTDKVMLIRERVTRIFFLRSFFDYPISLKLETFRNLGLLRSLKAGTSYLISALFPIRNEVSLEDFFINRFGRELYNTFFKDYTEKVWGISCDKIQADWGAQRVKGLSVTSALFHALKNTFLKDTSIGQKKVETSLIEQFMYPKLGAGQLWEEVAARVIEMGGIIHLNSKVVGFDLDDGKVKGVRIMNLETDELMEEKGNYFFSTMPVKDLIGGMSPAPPEEVRTVADGLVYRDLIVVGLLLRKLKIRNETKRKTFKNIVPDHWIYIQERDVRLGRLQILNNLSPYMVKDVDTVMIGLEYFCNEGDDLWEKTEEELAALAIDELAKIEIIDKHDMLDSIVFKVSKTYPAYFGSYGDFQVIRDFVDKFENLYLIGRNGMHRYNNIDHSMLTAMTAVENIIQGKVSKRNIWEINTEEDYHESTGVSS